MLDGCLGSVDGRVVEQQRSGPRTNGVSEVGEEVSEGLCIERLRPDMPEYQPLSG